MKRLQSLLRGATLVPLLAGCSGSLSIGSPPPALPNCPSPSDHIAGGLSAVVLAAQSVPTAALIPCLHPLPAGWTFHDLNAQSGKARTRLNFGQDNTNAATVTLTRDCNVQDATPTASDRADTRRYEQVDHSDSGFLGSRYEVFSGGCVTYRFDVHGAAAAEAVVTISRSFGFVDRAALRRYVHDDSGGRIEMDPTPERG